MKIATCENTPKDYVAWFKYRVSFEEKTVRLLVLVIILGALISLAGSLSNNFAILAISILFVAVGSAVWCLYCRMRLDKELREFGQTIQGEKSTIKFSKHGIEVIRNSEKTYYPFGKVVKAREMPWFLFLFVENENLPFIIDKKKIETVNDTSEPYYIAKKLREQSPDYRYIRGDDLTYTGKYSSLLKDN